MDTLRIGDKLLLKWGDGVEKQAEVVDTRGDDVELKVDGEPGTLFLELAPTGDGKFASKPSSRSIRCQVF